MSFLLTYFPSLCRDELLKKPHEVNGSDDLKAQLANAGDKLVVIDLYSPGCPACQQIGPKVDEIAETMADKVVVLKVNLRMENNSELSKEYKIEFVPTFVFVKNGQNVDRLVGSNEDLLVNTVNKHLQ